MEVEVRKLSFCLEATAGIRLHPYQAAQVYALVGTAMGAGKKAFPDGAMVHAPERGRVEVREGERFSFGLSWLGLGDEDAQERTGQLRKALEGWGRRGGGTLGGNFNVVAVRDLVADRPLKPGDIPTKVSFSQFEREVERIRSARSMEIEILTPFRKPRSKGDSAPGSRFYDASGIPGEALARAVLGRVRALHGRRVTVDAAESIGVEEAKLTWLDLDYGGRGHKTTLGGVVGTLKVDLLDPKFARPLALAQHVGIGQNTKFGHGQVRCSPAGPDPARPERAYSLLDLALVRSLKDGQVEKVAQMESLEAGRLTRLVGRALDGQLPADSHRFFQLRSSEGKSREFRVPSVEERALQRLVLAVLVPALDNWFERSSFAHRKGLSTKKAAAAVQKAYADGFCHVMRADFERFYDRIDHGWLRHKLDVYLDDPLLVEALIGWVGDGPGIPTGAPISPVLGNLFLDEFDERIEAQGGRLVRYADDLVVLARTEADLNQLEAVARQEAADVELALNESKTARFAPGESFEFLGFRFEVRPSGSGTPTFAAKDQRGTHGDLSRLHFESAATEHSTFRPRYVLSGEFQETAFGTGQDLVFGPEKIELVRTGEFLAGSTEAVADPIRWRISGVDTVLFLGPASISSEAWAALRDSGIEVHFLQGRKGQGIRRLGSDGLDLAASTIRAQLAASEDVEQRLAISRSIVKAKLGNYAALAAALEPDGEGAPVVARLRAASIEAVAAPSIATLLGIEGNAANGWYGSLRRALPRPLRFRRRQAPGATDAANAILNLGHSILHRWTSTMIRQESLVPTLGVFHTEREGHGALASDLQEPFRHLVDRVLVEVAEEHTPASLGHFDEGRGRYELRGSIVRLVIVRLAWHLRTEVAAKAGGDARSYLGWMRTQVRSFKRSIHQAPGQFIPFEHP